LVILPLAPKIRICPKVCPNLPQNPAANIEKLHKTLYFTGDLEKNLGQTQAQHQRIFLHQIFFAPSDVSLHQKNIFLFENYLIMVVI
jgi:hypothetical protein